MSKGKSAQLVTGLRQRIGEGALIGVQHHQVAHTDGTSTSTFGVNLGDAPVPERKYVADVAAISQLDGQTRMLFGQWKLGAKELRSLIVVHMSPDAVVNFVESVIEISRRLKEFLGRTEIDPLPLASELVEPAQTIAFASNVVVCGFSGLEATLDFYHASAFSLDRVLRKSPELAIDPIVRINTSSRLLLSMLEETSRQSEHLKSPLRRIANGQV